MKGDHHVILRVVAKALIPKHLLMLIRGWRVNRLNHFPGQRKVATHKVVEVRELSIQSRCLFCSEVGIVIVDFIILRAFVVHIIAGGVGSVGCHSYPRRDRTKLNLSLYTRRDPGGRRRRLERVRQKTRRKTILTPSPSPCNGDTGTKVGALVTKTPGRRLAGELMKFYSLADLNKSI